MTELTVYSPIRDFKPWFLIVIGFFYFGQGYALGSLVLLLPIYIKEELGASGFAESVLVSAIIISPWYVKFIFGMLSDNFTVGSWGRRKPYLVIASIFSVIGWLAIGNHNQITILFTLSGISLALGSAIADSVIDGQAVEITPPQYIARLQGVAWGSRGLGIGLTGVASTRMIDNYGWDTMFFVSAFFGISITIVVLILPELHLDEDHLKTSKKELVRNSIQQTLLIPSGKDRVYFFLLTGMVISLVPLLSIIMRSEFDYSFRQIGDASVFFAIGSFVGAMGNGILFDRNDTFQRVIIVYFNLGLVIMGGLSFIWVNGLYLQFSYFAIVGLATGAFEANQLKVIQELVPKNFESTGFAIYTGFSNIGQFILSGYLIVLISETLDISLFIPIQVLLIVLLLGLTRLRNIRYSSFK